MSTLPQAIVVIDPVADQNAVKEAKKKKIPVVALTTLSALVDLTGTESHTGRTKNEEERLI